MKEIPNYPNYFITKGGKVWSKPRGKWLKPIVAWNGYLVVSLYKNKVYRKRIHRLVLETFVGPCPKRMECRHLDGNRQNNNLSNLKWGTRSENMQDAIKHGTIIGERGHNHKLIGQDVRTIIYIYRTGEFSQKEIASLYKLKSDVTIHQIVNRKTWKHIWNRL